MSVFHLSGVYSVITSNSDFIFSPKLISFSIFIKGANFCKSASKKVIYKYTEIEWNLNLISIAFKDSSFSFERQEVLFCSLSKLNRVPYIMTFFLSIFGVITWRVFQKFFICVFLIKLTFFIFYYIKLTFKNVFGKYTFVTIHLKILICTYINFLSYVRPHLTM